MTCKLMSHDEFHASATFPFHLTRASNSTWTSAHRDHIANWIETHCGASWVYFDGVNGYVFGSQGDHILFVMWLKSNPFEGKWQEEEK